MAMNTKALAEAMRVSEQLSPTDQLQLISWLSTRLHSLVATSAPPVDLLASAGLGAEIWQQIDVEAYLRQERASWED